MFKSRSPPNKPGRRWNFHAGVPGGFVRAASVIRALGAGHQLRVVSGHIRKLGVELATVEVFTTIRQFSWWRECWSGVLPDNV